jgi:hypothetical protein
MQFDRDLVRQWSNLVVIIAAFATNVFANVRPINGLSIGDISNNFFKEVPIIPANYAFAIWGLIYLGLIGLAIYQALPANKNNPRLRRLGYWLVIASLAQIIWIFLFQSQLFAFSVIAILAILLPLILLYLRLEIGQESVWGAQKWLVNIPVSIYLAWISVATIVNVASTLYYWGWNGWGISYSFWTIAMMLVATILAAIAIVRRNELAFPAVFIWALIAIAVRNFNNSLLAISAAGFAIFLLFLLTTRKARSLSHM